MPRLSNKDYWKHHKTLRYLWLNYISAYGYLSQARQRQLHQFFQPSKDWTKEELLAYRKQITARDPYLAHQAPWAMKELQKVVEAPARVRTPTRYARNKRTIVRAIYRPEPDTDKLARAFTMMAARELGISLPEIERRLQDDSWKNRKR